MCVESLLPERLVVPKVFANGDAEFAIVSRKEMTFTSRLEVARIVEDVVLRQQRLIGKADQLLIANDGGGVVESAPGWQTGWSTVPTIAVIPSVACDDLFQRLQERNGNVAIEKPVERGVALDAGLGEYDQIRLVLLRLLDRANDAGSVAFVVAVGGVYLTDGDAHLFWIFVFGFVL